MVVLSWPKGKIPSGEKLLGLLVLTEDRLSAGILLSEGQTESKIDAVLIVESSMST